MHLGKSHSAAAVTLLSNSELEESMWSAKKPWRLCACAKTHLDTLALGQRDPWLVLTDNEHVRLPGGEGVVNSVLDVDNVETTIVALTVGDHTNTTHVTTTGDHDKRTSVELDEVRDLAGGEVDLHGVIDLDERVGVADAVCRTKELA